MNNNYADNQRVKINSTFAKAIYLYQYEHTS